MSLIASDMRVTNRKERARVAVMRRVGRDGITPCPATSRQVAVWFGILPYREEFARRCSLIQSEIVPCPTGYCVSWHPPLATLRPRFEVFVGCCWNFVVPCKQLSVSLLPSLPYTVAPHCSAGFIGSPLPMQAFQDALWCAWEVLPSC